MGSRASARAGKKLANPDFCIRARTARTRSLPPEFLPGTQSARPARPRNRADSAVSAVAETLHHRRRRVAQEAVPATRRAASTSRRPAHGVIRGIGLGRGGQVRHARATDDASGMPTKCTASLTGTRSQGAWIGVADVLGGKTTMRRAMNRESRPPRACGSSNTPRYRDRCRDALDEGRDDVVVLLARAIAAAPRVAPTGQCARA